MEASLVIGNREDFIKLCTAFRAWVRVTNSENSEDGVRQFFDFLGVPRDTPQNYYQMQQSKFQLPTEAVNRMDWLNSPHAATLYKAWQAQNGKL